MIGQTSNRTIARNTVMLYMRMLLTVVVGLYTSRVVLLTLGVEDYGIYGVVGGIVSMLGFLNSSMAGATSRFLTYELGKGNVQKLTKTFSSALFIHVIIGAIVVFFAETIGLWFLNNKLVIPTERMYAAHIVYQLSIISAVLNFTQVPYNSCIIAHEKMDVYAYVEMANVLLKLLIVFLLGFGGFDKLILYAVLVLCISVVVMLIYRIYCIHKFEECRFHFVWDMTIIKPLLSFSGWNVYTTICYTGRQQGFNFILNIFGGAVLNAAASLAATVDGIVTGFASSVVMAIRPSLIKLYAMGDIHKMEYLLEFAVLVLLFLYFVVVVPLMVEADFVLSLWLGNVPAHTLHFLRIVLVASSFSLLNTLLVIIVHAAGTIKLNSIISGSISLLILLPLYVFLKKGYNVDFVYAVVIVSNFLITITHVCCIRKMFPQIKIISISAKALLLLVLECIVSYSFGAVSVGHGVKNMVIIFFLNMLLMMLFVLVMMTKTQKTMVCNYIQGKINAVKKTKRTI